MSHHRRGFSSPPSVFISKSVSGSVSSPSLVTPHEEDSRLEFLYRRPSAIQATQYENSLLELGAALTADKFKFAVCLCLHSVLDGARKAECLLFDQTSHELSYFISATDTKPLPTTGIIWKVVRRRKEEVFHSVAKDDPFWEVMNISEDKRELYNGSVVVVYPLVSVMSKVVAIMMCICDEPDLKKLNKLAWVQKNAVVAAERVNQFLVVQRDKGRMEQMLNVCGGLVDLDVGFLCLRLHKYMKSMIGCKVCLILTIDHAMGELVCQVFDDIALDQERRLSISECIYGQCLVANGGVIQVDDVSVDPRINPAVDFINDYEPQNILCMEIRGGEENSSCLGIAVAFDKLGGTRFTIEDHKSMSFVIQSCSNMLANTLAFQRELTLKRQNEALLQIAQELFTNLDAQDTLLQTIMKEARTLTKAERCSLFLMDDDSHHLVSVVFDSKIKSPSDPPLRIPVGQGIAGYVAETGETVNIKNAYGHPMFYKEVDKATGFTTRNILCIPIKVDTGIVGVAQLINRKGGKFFTKYDEELAKSFSVYCGISIYNSMLYSKMQKERSRSRLATELMVYHMKIPDEESKVLAAVSIPGVDKIHPRMQDFTFNPRFLPDDSTPLAVVSMMEAMGLIQRWKIPRNKLARFILMVKKDYRDVPYHNWKHALAVAHFSFTLHKCLQEPAWLTELEILALFISCLCHDIDHRGTNNSFHIRANSTLATLYSSEGSLLERHHFAQTLCILNTEGCSIFEHFSTNDYHEILDLVQWNILATDLVTHLKHMSDIEAMAEEGYSPSNKYHHKLLSSLIMTACDLNNSCKDWESALAVSELIYQEFFTQGDLEKALGEVPCVMMDREKVFIPEQQLQFLDNITLPVYKILTKLIPGSSPAYQSLQENRDRWKKLRDDKQYPGPSLPMLTA